MKRSEATASAGSLAFNGGRRVFPKIKAAHRKRFFRELGGSWDLWYALLGEPSEALSAEEASAVRTVERLLSRLASPSLLDLGCGDGAILKRLAPHCASARGADVSAEALRRARRACRGMKNVGFDRVTSTTLPFADASFDLILCRRMFSHLDLEPVVLYLREARRVLKPKGRLLFDLPDIRHEPYWSSLLSEDGTNWPGNHRPRFWTVGAARLVVGRCGFRVESLKPGAWFEITAARA